MLLEIGTQDGEILLKFARDDGRPVADLPMTVDQCKLLINDLGGCVHWLSTEEARAR